MNTAYKDYAERIRWLWESMTGMVWLKLTYIASKSDWLDTYTNYISSKFFQKKEKLSSYDIEEKIVFIESTIQAYIRLQEEIQKDENIDSELKLFLFKNIEENKKKAEIAKRSVFFEAEKSGYDIFFSWSRFEVKKNEEKIENMWLPISYNQEKQTYLEDINHLQASIYVQR